MKIDHFPHVWQPGDESKPTLLALHGTGGNEHDLLQIAEAVMPGASVLSPRGLVNEMGMPRWFRRLQEGVFDIEDLKFRTHELMEWLTLARQEYKIDRLNVIGYSNGANIAANLMLQGYDGFEKVVSLRPMYTDTPKENLDLSSTQIALHVGEQDPICPPGSAEELTKALQQTKATVQVQMINAGHNLTQADIVLASEFFSQ